MFVWKTGNSEDGSSFTSVGSQDDKLSVGVLATRISPPLLPERNNISVEPTEPMQREGFEM